MAGGGQPFISRTTATLDAKGRICIPASFRQILASQGTSGVYLRPSFAHQALEGFGEQLLEAVQQRVATLDPFFDTEYDVRAASVLSNVFPLPLDENGRIRLPEDLIAHAALKERVLFAGMGSKFQIWDPDAFATVERGWLESARASRLGAANGGARE